MIQKITFVGAGNVAQHLAVAFEQHGLEVECVFSRNLAKAQQLAQKLRHAKAQNHLNFNDATANLFVLAVRDDAIEEVCQQISLPKNTFVVHTSGTQSLEVLGNLQNPLGVFYPLQTFSADKVIDFQAVPFCIEANSPTHEVQLLQLAALLSKKVYQVNSAQRQSLHLAAVFANNFSNYLFGVAEELLSRADLPFDLLKPLLHETVEKAILLNPFEAQTGPARRNDTKTIKKHLDLLCEQPSLRELYELLSNLIRERYN